MGEKEREPNRRRRLDGAWLAMGAAALVALVLMGWLGIWLQVSRRVQVRWAEGRSGEGSAVLDVANRGSFAITPETLSLSYVRDGVMVAVHRIRFREGATLAARGQDRVPIPPMPAETGFGEPVATPGGPENRRMIMGVLTYRSLWGGGAAHFCLTPR